MRINAVRLFKKCIVTENFIDEVFTVKYPKINPHTRANGICKRFIWKKPNTSVEKMTACVFEYGSKWLIMYFLTSSSSSIGGSTTKFTNDTIIAGISVYVLIPEGTSSPIL